MSRVEIVVSPKNSTTVPLAAGAEWIGTGEDIASFQEIDLNVAGAPSDAQGTLTFEFSPNGTNWDISVPLQLAGPTIIPLPLRVVLPKFRVRYLNGATPLTELRITTIYHRANSKNLTRFLGQPLTYDTPIEAVRAVMAAQKPDASFTTLQLTASNELPVSVANFPAQIETIDPYLQKRYDVQSNAIYVGYAIRGAASGAAAWKIKKTDLDVNGNPTHTRWTSLTAVWDNRTSETYS